MSWRGLVWRWFIFRNHPCRLRSLFAWLCMIAEFDAKQEFLSSTPPYWIIEDIASTDLPPEQLYKQMDRAGIPKWVIPSYISAIKRERKAQCTLKEILSADLITTVVPERSTDPTKVA